MDKSKKMFYRFTANKRMMVWSIWIEKKNDEEYVIVTEHGIKNMKIARDKGVYITKGKAGRTIADQVQSQYLSMIKKKTDSGYTRNVSGLNTDLLISPMLAQNFEKHKKKIRFPALTQPKLDGVRCIIQVKNGTVSLLSRLGKPFSHMDQIRDAILAVKLPENIVLDGELFSDELHFQTVVGLVKRKKIRKEDSENLAKIKFNAFDLIHLNDLEMIFSDRWKLLDQIVKKDSSEMLKIVPIYPVQNEEDISLLLAKFLANGDEGIMIRNKDSLYERKRSYHLQKFKKFFDDEYEIVGAEQGQGNAIGTVIWICKNEEGRTFRVRPVGTREVRKKMYTQREQYFGKKLTVKFQELTPDKIPRFPVGLAIRDYE